MYSKRHYISIAKVLTKKLDEVEKWNNPEAHSLALAYIEDFINLFEADNPKFNKARFITYINEHRTGNGKLI